MQWETDNRFLSSGSTFTTRRKHYVELEHVSWRKNYIYGFYTHLTNLRMMRKHVSWTAEIQQYFVAPSLPFMENGKDVWSKNIYFAKIKFS